MGEKPSSPIVDSNVLNDVANPAADPAVWVGPVLPIWAPVFVTAAADEGEGEGEGVLDPSADRAGEVAAWSKEEGTGEGMGEGTGGGGRERKGAGMGQKEREEEGEKREMISAPQMAKSNLLGLCAYPHTACPNDTLVASSTGSGSATSDDDEEGSRGWRGRERERRGEESRRNMWSEPERCTTIWFSICLTLNVSGDHDVDGTATRDEAEGLEASEARNSLSEASSAVTPPNTLCPFTLNTSLPFTSPSPSLPPFTSTTDTLISYDIWSSDRDDEEEEEDREGERGSGERESSMSSWREGGLMVSRATRGDGFNTSGLLGEEGGGARDCEREREREGKGEGEVGQEKRVCLEDQSTSRIEASSRSTRQVESPPTNEASRKSEKGWDEAKWGRASREEQGRSRIWRGEEKVEGEDCSDRGVSTTNAFFLPITTYLYGSVGSSLILFISVPTDFTIHTRLTLGCLFSPVPFLLHQSSIIHQMVSGQYRRRAAQRKVKEEGRREGTDAGMSFQSWKRPSASRIMRMLANMEWKSMSAGSAVMINDECSIPRFDSDTTLVFLCVLDVTLLFHSSITINHHRHHRCVFGLFVHQGLGGQFLFATFCCC